MGAIAKPAPTFSLTVSFWVVATARPISCLRQQRRLLNDALLCLSVYTRQGNNLKESCFNCLFTATIDRPSSAELLLDRLCGTDLDLLLTWVPGWWVILRLVADPPDAFDRGRASWELVRQ